MFNNNKIELPYSSMNGIVSNKTFFKCIEELIEKEWITKDGNGGLMRNKNKYGLTFKYDTYLKGVKTTKKKK